MSSKSRSGKPTRKAVAGTHTGRGSQRPAPVAQGSSARRRLEVFSAPILITLHGLPRFVVPVLLASALFVGLLLAGSWAWLGGVLLALIGLFVGWLTALSWPVLTPGSRLIRVVVTTALLGLAVLKALGRW